MAWGRCMGLRLGLGLGLMASRADLACAQAYRVVAIDTAGHDPTRVIPAHVMPDGTVVGLYQRGGGWREFAWRSEAAEWIPAGFNDLGLARSSAGTLRGITPTIWVQTLPPAESGGPGVPGAEISAQVWRVDGALATLPPLNPGGSAGAKAATPGGLVVGWSVDGPIRGDGVWSVQATMWRVGVPLEPKDPLEIGAAIPLGSLPDYAFSVGRAVNSAGSVVGVSFNASAWDGPPVDAVGAIWSEQSAFLIAGGAMHEIDALLVTPDWHITDVISILDNGVMTAIGEDALGMQRPVVLEPVCTDPEAGAAGDRDEAVADDGSGRADGPVPSETYMWYFLSQLYTTLTPPPTSDSDVLLRIRLGAPTPTGLRHSWQTPARVWNMSLLGRFHEEFNSACAGCAGRTPGNPHTYGQPGFAGDDPNNPLAPHGGPGGNGARGFPVGGDGGPGGNGAAPNGAGGHGGDGGLGNGRGGRGGNGAGTGLGGAGGDGGIGIGAEPVTKDGGDGGEGGSGGESNGYGGPGGRGGPGSGSEQSNGGRGGDGGSGGGDRGAAGSGGPGGDARPAQPRVPGRGGNGGAGGNGGKGGPHASGGHGGNGGEGNDGKERGGDGGNGGKGGRGGTMGRGGDGGDGGMPGGVPGAGGMGRPAGKNGRDLRLRSRDALR